MLITKGKFWCALSPSTLSLSLPVRVDWYFAHLLKPHETDGTQGETNDGAPSPLPCSVLYALRAGKLQPVRIIAVLSLVSKPAESHPPRIGTQLGSRQCVLQNKSVI